MFEFTFNKDLTVCFQERPELPYWNLYSELTCSFFYKLNVGVDAFDTPNGTLPLRGSLPPTISTFFIPLRNKPYYVGMYFLTPPYVNNYNATVSVRGTGDTCETEGTYWDGTNCDKAHAFKSLNETISVVFKTMELNLYTIEVPELVGLLHFSISDITPSTQVWMRREGNPTHKIHDASSEGGRVVSYVLPRPGVWVVAVLYDEFFPDNYTHTLTVYGEQCKEPGKAGPACTLSYSKSENDADALVSSRHYSYWEVKTGGSPISVSVFTSKPGLLPNLYASQDQLPVRDNADLSLCNQEYCGTVRTLKINSDGKNQTWYFGVISNWESRNISFAIWFNSTCIPGCEMGNGSLQRGTCRNDGSCVCSVDFTGLDCSTYLGSGAQWKVLYLVIGILVFIVLVGVVIWYTRKKNKPKEDGFS